MSGKISRDQRARGLAAIGRGLTYARSLDEMLEMTIDCTIDLTGAERVAVLLGDATGGLRVRASRGIPEESAQAFQEPLDEKLLARLNALFDVGSPLDFLAVPLVVAGAVIGLLAVSRDDDPKNDEDEEWLLSALADQAALAVETTHLRDLERELQGRVGLLERERRDKDHALEILSHDLRSPLNAIQGYTSLLAAEILGPVNERQQEALRKMRRISEHLTALLGNVLDMARLTSGNLALNIGPVSLRQVISDAVDIARPAAERVGIRIETTGASDQRVETDASRLSQVVTQLLDNAVKYSPDSTTVRIEQKPLADGGAEIVVADEGHGVPADLRERIFEPYVRADDDSTRGQAGVGLGLAIARVVIERLGGTLTLDDGSGSGATFRVRLPAKAPPQ